MHVFVTEAGSSKSTTDDTVSDWHYLDKNYVLLTVVGICVLVILLSIAFVCYRQWKNRQLSNKLNLTSTPAREALLSRTDQPDSALKSIQQSNTAAANDSTDYLQKSVLF